MKTHHRIITLTLITLLVLSVRLTAEEPKPKHVIHVRPNVAHRGNSSAAPENTLAAFRAAIEAGADGAECDVRRSADGVLFLSHDRTAKRTMGGSDDDDLTQMTFEKIRKFDAGSWKDPWFDWTDGKFKGEKVPSLDEYLKALKGTKCHPVIEIKQQGIATEVVETVRKNEMVDVTTIIAFGEDHMEAVRRLEPKMCVAWLYNEHIEGNHYDSAAQIFDKAEENADRLAEFFIKRCRALDIAIVIPNDGSISPKLIKLLHEADIHVWVWTVNNAPRMERLLDWGVESITTDKPEMLTEILKERQ
jgi:glycerophosphoryl diester phosphodiesterase